MIENYPWKTKGIVLTAPLPDDVDDVCRFIDTVLFDKVNLIVMQTRYRYQFKKHPECTGRFALSESDVKKLVAVCKKHGIKLIPKMNLFGHQSGLPNDPDDGILHGATDARPTIPDGLFAAYPGFDEQQDEEIVFYSRSICLSNPEVAPVVCDLMDELLDVYEADAIHIGCDEAFALGLCPRCKGKDNSKLFGDWITTLHDHLALRGATMMMWSDRFLNAEETGYNVYEASGNGTYKAIETVAKDIIFCDWHYEDQQGKYPSVDVFEKAGHKMFLSPWRNLKNATAFINYAKAGNYGNVLGVLLTTWCSSGELARLFMGEGPAIWKNTAEIAATIRALYF